MFVSVKLWGGLGNQLFMLARAYAFAMETGRQCVIYQPCAHPSEHSRVSYVKTIFSKFPTVNEPAPDCTVLSRTDHWIFDASVPEVAQKALHVHFTEGYWQSAKYFDAYRRSFVDKLVLPDEGIQQNTCFIHVRRKDYLNHPHMALAHDYYPKAIQAVLIERPGTEFSVFSDDIEWCKVQPVFKGMTFVEERDEMRALKRMSSCRVGGICANSTFSWWGVYLNESQDKVAVFPYTWQPGIDASMDVIHASISRAIYIR